MNPNWTYELRNKEPVEILISGEEPYQILGTWKSWDVATDDYNGKPPHEGDPDYMLKFVSAYVRGQHYYNGTRTEIWPILSNREARK